MYVTYILNSSLNKNNIIHLYFTFKVSTLWAKMNDKDNKLREVLKNLQDKQEDCIQLKEAASMEW